LGKEEKSKERRRKNEAEEQNEGKERSDEEPVREGHDLLFSHF
jgi:hypothetical protein